MATLMGAPRFCKRCRKHRNFLSIDSAAKLTGCNRSSVYRWINKEWLHWLDLPSGHRLVCLQSLTAVHPINLFLLARLEGSGRRRSKVVGKMISLS
jgi:predicted DNA-binding transcriptional regulator AlpA